MKILCRRLKIFGVLWSVLVNLKREFMKQAIVICTILAVFQYYISFYFYMLLVIINEKPLKSLGYQGESSFFSSMWPLVGHPVLNVKLFSKTTLCHKNYQHSNSTLFDIDKNIVEKVIWNSNIRQLFASYTKQSERYKKFKTKNINDVRYTAQKLARRCSYRMRLCQEIKCLLKNVIMLEYYCYEMKLWCKERNT